MLVIQEAFPNIIGKDIDKVEFKTKSGLSAEDILIDEIGFSVRTSNALHRAELHSIINVANLRQNKLREIKNLGSKSVKEILDYLSTNAVVYCKGEQKNDFVDQVYKCVTEIIKADNPEYDISGIARELLIAINENKLELMEYIGEVVSDSKKESICDAMKNIIAKSINMQEIFASIFLSVFSNTQDILELSSFFDIIPQIFNYDGVVQSILSKLEDEKRIEYINGGYRIRLPYLEEWIDTLDDKQKLIISMRVRNKTLEECGQVLNVTRERIRQIESKALKKRPILREDDYEYWYSKYEINLETMQWIFGVEESVYYYLKIAYKSGRIDIEKMLDDSKMNASLYTNYQSYINRESILVNGEYIRIKREDLRRYLIKYLYSDAPVLYSTFFEKYNEFLANNNLANNEKLLFENERAIETFAKNSMYVLQMDKKRMRYYPIYEYDIESLIESLHLERYKDIEISTAKIYRDNEEIMVEYNIQDEYELHNLMNKTQSVWNDGNKYDLEITRMPFISFGKADREKQAEWLLYQIAPVTQEEFGQFYEEEFGIKANTAISNMGKYINQYYHAGMFRVDQPLLSEEEKSYMLTIANDDFYFVDELEVKFMRQFGKERLSHLNPRTYKELGFKVFAGYLIRDVYASADEFFEKEFTRDTMLDLTKYDARLIYVQSAYQVLERLRSNYDLIEYEDKKYISYEHFSNVAEDINKDTLMLYVDEAINSSGNEKYFTIKSLKRDGFESELHNLGFNDWFNAALIKNSKKIRYIRTADGIIFAKSDSQPTLLDFLCYVLAKKRKMDIYDFLRYIEETYGIKLRKDKVTWIIKESPLYYDSVMEKIYFDKEDYYEDI